MLLREFITTNNDELIARCQSKVAKQPAPHPNPGDLKHGIPQFLKQLGDRLAEGRHNREPPGRL